MAKALTGASLAKLKADAEKRVEVPDGVLAGLYFIIQPTGKKSWAVRYRHNGKPKKMALGNYLAGDDAGRAGEELKKVRREAAEILESVRAGADPAAEKQDAKRLVKQEDESRRDQFRIVAERYLREYASKRRNFAEKARLLGLRRKGEDWEAIAGKPAAIWSTKRVQEISRRDIRDYVEGMASTTAPIGANRAFAELRKFFNWTVGKDILTVSPMAGLQPPSEENASRNRVLIRRVEVPGSTDDELLWLWKAAANYDRNDEGERNGGGRRPRGPFGPFVQMLILTGQRRSEVSGMTWREVDLEQRLWTIPGSRAKNGLPHAVPLSDAAVALLEGRPRIKGCNYVFTTDGESTISGFSRMKNRLDKLMKEAAGKEAEIPAWTVHDLRRSVAAGMQRLGVRLEVTERVLNHLSGSFAGVAGIYQVHDFHDEKRAALDAWGRFVTALVQGKGASNVTYLHKERA